VRCSGYQLLMPSHDTFTAYVTTLCQYSIIEHVPTHRKTSHPAPVALRALGPWQGMPPHLSAGAA
jgi:hypothetical protein